MEGKDCFTGPIDIVITWVDGDDPAHRARRQAYLTGRHEEKIDAIAGETRYRSLGEIEFCVGSILRFAPFVRSIYIVTDGQDPHLEPFINRNFPDNKIPVRIIDHKEVFRGYERFLPIFNSRSIETALWRIPGLSEHYVYLNDDFLLTNKVEVSDWFDAKGRPVVYGYWHNTLTAWMCRAWERASHSTPPLKFRDGMLNAALLAGGRALRRFVRIQHAPQPMLKSVFKSFFEKHPEAFERNINCRFREPHQFNPQCLHHTLLCLRGDALLRPNKGVVTYLMPFERGKERFDGYMSELERNTDAKFCCINSLDKATDAQRRRVCDWVSRRVGLDLSY